MVMLAFLLTFEPVDANSDSNPFGTAKPLRVLLEPYITDYSVCLLDLLEPDVVIVSKHRVDHCSEATPQTNFPLQAPKLPFSQT